MIDAVPGGQLADEEPASVEPVVLKTGFELLQQEFKRIFSLTQPREEHPLGIYAAPIGRKFGSFESRVENVLAEYRAAIERSDLETAWEKYIELKTQLMPNLSSEMLAVIGGAYLMRENLDSVRQESPLSFSNLASRLMADLANRTDKLTGSILIVGEERVGYLEAEIIRLRFPGCDLWNLPFTAHEYGYLVAHRGAPAQFSDLKAMVRNLVDPANHGGAPPANKVCFLPRIVREWNEFHHAPPERPYTRDEQELKALKQAQETILCRLFADAFATFFVGPAYVYALLYLRFVPDETLYGPGSTGPPFAHRFVFALETLRWMNGLTAEYAQAGWPQKPGPFHDLVVDPDGFFPQLWQETVSSAGREHLPYQSIAKSYGPWLQQVHQALTQAWRGRRAVRETFESWREALDLQKSLTDPTMTVASRPNPWTILNAAWLARTKAEETPSDVEIIQRNALRLLDPKDHDVVQSRQRSGGLPAVVGRGTPYDRPVRASSQPTTADDGQALVQKVVGALGKAGQTDLVVQFSRMASSGRFEALAAIVTTLADNDKEALDAYMRLLVVE